MYEFYNANPLGKFEEDCTIRAISCATNKSWDYVYDLLSDIAQYEGTMMDNRKFIIDFLDKRYRKIYTNGETVGELSLKYANNVLLITMNGHIVCSKYGKIYDTFDSTKRKVEFAWIVK